MSRSQLPLTNEVRFCVSGNVTIHPTAAIATNVVLHANPGSTITIGPGVVIGKGSIIHAHGGTLTIGNEVTLGNQVLLFGQGAVQPTSCIGSMTTIMGVIHVEAGSMIPPGKLIGAPDVHPTPPDAIGSEPSATAHEHNRTSTNAAIHSPVQEPSNNGHGHVSGKRDRMETTNSYSATNKGTTSNSSVAETVEDGGVGNGANPETSQSSTESVKASPSVVYGQASVQRLISMMFPHRSSDTSGNGKE